MSEAKITFQELRASWDAYNDIPYPTFDTISLDPYLRARAAKWAIYVRVRDSYLIQEGIEPLPRHIYAPIYRGLDA